ncbi:Uncharacterized protein At1g65710 [Linum perenne]
MGSCFSKKTVSAACPAGEVQQKREEKKEEDEREEKKEVFVIKHRDSHERRSPSPVPSPEVVLESGKVSTTTSMAVRTSSCTKEEVEAILIQCGRLSRNNSFGTPGKAAVASGGGGGGSVGRRSVGRRGASISITRKEKSLSSMKRETAGGSSVITGGLFYLFVL